jgi:hypothetical protein
LTWRGIRDVFEQFIFMVGLSLAWWLCAVPAVLGVMLFLTAPILLPVALLSVFLIPPATVTLFSMADPRRIVNKPDREEMVAVFLSSVKRGWMIGLSTVPLLLILAWNIAYFQGSNSFLAAFVPLWAILIIFLFILALYMYSLAGTMESQVRNAFRGGMYVLITRPFTGAFLSVLIIVVAVVFGLMVLPMLLIGPALLAAVVNRFVLDALQVEVIDPNSPTTERAYEREKGINPEPTVWDRIKRGGRKEPA